MLIIDDRQLLFRRVLERLLITEACWEWQGAKSKGYGRIGRPVPQRGSASTHVVVYEALRGPVPAERELDHLCRNRACANPNHLEPVTRSENNKRGLLGRLKPPTTHCPQGHAYTPENTYQLPSRNARTCRICHKTQSTAWAARKRASSAVPC